MSEPASWEVLLEVAHDLTRRGLTPFTRRQLIEGVQVKYPLRQRSSLDPTIQGMTSNAPGGPPASCGEPFLRIDRGRYQLAVDADSNVGTVAPSIVRPATSRRAPSVEHRVRDLIQTFGDCVVAYDEAYPFTRKDQYESHRLTISRRRHIGSVAGAIADRSFVLQLHDTLGRWGIGKRGSRLVDPDALQVILQDFAGPLEALDGLRIEDPDLDAPSVADALWRLVRDLPVVNNNAKIVAGTKTLHHLLPDLVVPMDRAWTGMFFRWSTADPQYRQEKTFTSAYRHYVDVARQVTPSRFVGDGWRTSSTKVLDNAMIGWCKRNLDAA